MRVEGSLTRLRLDPNTTIGEQGEVQLSLKLGKVKPYGSPSDICFDSCQKKR